MTDPHGRAHDEAAEPTTTPATPAVLGPATPEYRGGGTENGEPAGDTVPENGEPAGDTVPENGEPAGDTAPEGNSIVAASWIGTVVFAATSALGAAAEQLDIAALVVALAMFAAGTVVFFVAFARAVTRSRTDEIGVMNLFFLDRSAPRPVRRTLLASLGVEIATAIAAAAARPNTSLAFGILAPVYALSLMGLYGARHGVFPKR